MSEIRATTISDLAGTGPATLTGQYAAKAWVNFNGTGTVAIRESGNVSSITDVATGQFTVGFAAAMPDANYAAAWDTDSQTVTNCMDINTREGTRLTGSVGCLVETPGGNAFDDAFNTCVVTR